MAAAALYDRAMDVGSQERWLYSNLARRTPARD
jgi:hypothetical protein